MVDGRRERSIEWVLLMEEMKAAEEIWVVEKRPAPPSLIGRKAWE